MDPVHLFRDAIAQHLPHDGTFDCALPGVKLIRCSTPTLPMPVVYEPTACFVAQGRKRATVGAGVLTYGPGSYLVASVGMPVVGAVIEATATHPYLSLQLDLDGSELSELALRLPPLDGRAGPAHAGLTLNETTPPLTEAVTRLVRLLASPADAEVLGPSAIREVFYRLLTGASGAVIRAMAQADSRHGQIARSIVWIRAHFKEAFRLEQVADVAGMSRSAFHEHFKAVTAMSPLAFRNQLRMQEARRLMVSKGLDAAEAGFSVGYESPSQFSRDYARLFGEPPAKDAHRLRQAGAATA